MLETKPASTLPVLLPREIVLASAGTGKTFRLSSRLIALLNAGVAPGEVLASTFTRKAAGEILERVLLRLARAQISERELEELARHASLEGVPELDRGRAASLLARLVDELHRVNVSTLDAFFRRVAGAFAFELGLPPTWTVADPAEEKDLVLRAVDGLLERANDRELIELLRMYRSGEVARGVHGELVDIVTGLQELYRDLDPSASDPWGLHTGEASSPTDEEIESLADRVAGEIGPLKNDGSPRKRWRDAVDRHAKALRAREWDGVFRNGPFAKLLAGEPEYDGMAIPDEIRSLFGEVAKLARRDLEVTYRSRAQALGHLARHFEEAFTDAQRHRGVYRFQDIPHLLLQAGTTGRGAELYFRLDGRIRHLLLDEFQDTSVVQWRALVPLAGEILQDGSGERAAVVVADPKQSIYGWRGGEPRLLDVVASYSGIPVDSLDASYRSAGAVLDVVNAVFSKISASDALDDVQVQATEVWVAAFPVHRPAYEERSGYVRVVEVPGEPHRRTLREGALRAAVDEVVEIRREAPGASVGVLCRTRGAVTRTIHLLRTAGVEVSEEGGSPVVDAWPVHLVLAALRLADHPGDPLAMYVVSRCPLGPALGLGRAPTDREADRASRSVRIDLISRGYGPVLDEWAHLLRPRSAPRDRRRLDQLVELALRQDARGIPLRPLEFIEAVRRTPLENPGDASVRVMTVHAAKGLEFDAVVLPDLEGELNAARGDFGPLAEREDLAGPIVRIHPYVARCLQPLFPEAEAVDRERRASRFRDELGGLYVALTRARHAVHLIVERGRAQRTTLARFVRDGLGLVELDSAAEAPTVMGEWGHPRWAAVEGRDRGSANAAPTPAAPSIGPVELGSGSGSRSLARVTPSELAGGEGLRLTELLRQPDRRALERGTVVHAWLETVEWLEEGLPDRRSLLSLAAERAPRLTEPEALVDRFLTWIAAPPIRSLLSRSEQPPGTRVERELPFLARDGDRLVDGVADRVLRIPSAEGDRLMVVDWKIEDPTDAGPGAEDRLAYYRPQVAAYVRALASNEGIPARRATGVVAFVPAGVVREV